jgi:hypothetical protein
MSWRGVGKACVANDGWEERSFGEGGGVGYPTEDVDGEEEGMFQR